MGKGFPESKTVFRLQTFNSGEILLQKNNFRAGGAWTAPVPNSIFIRRMVIAEAGCAEDLFYLFAVHNRELGNKILLQDLISGGKVFDLSLAVRL